MNTKNRGTILIVEPNKTLTAPYIFLPSTYHITRVSTIKEGYDFVSHTLPNFLLVSSSFETIDLISFLEKVRAATHSKLPGICFVVDFAHKISNVPGVNWAGQSGLLSSSSQENEVLAVLDRCLG